MVSPVFYICFRDSAKALTGSIFTPAAVVLFALAFAAINYHPDATPFTFEEVQWAIKGGYLDDLVAHYLRNGGL